jgi:hypothetical protein
VVELSNGDFTSGLRRPLAAEIDKRPLLTSQIMSVTNERYTVDMVDESIGSVICGL